jgi:lipopolysaccharide transport protein LptA
LESARIWTNAAGIIRTTDNSVLKVGDSTVTGNDFVIQNGDILTFRTLRPATLKEKSGQESSSDQLQARFDGRENTLLELVQSGNFQFRTARYEGRARTGRFADGGSIVTLEGAAVVNDPDKRLEAAEIRINQKDNSFVATKNVSTLIKDPAEQVLVKAASAVGGGDSVLYTGNVQLWQKDGYIKTERLTATGQGQENVKMYAEASAEGKVESHLQNVRVTSRTLDYDDSSGIIRYLGPIRAQKQDMILETSEMTVHFRDGNVKEIAASGGVVVTRADQRGSGENAQYDAATDVVTLTGKNAQVSDREHGLIQGPTLTMKNRGENVLVTGTEGRRTITKHPVKNNKK